MADYRRPMAGTLIVLVLCLMLTACGPNERQTRQAASAPAAAPVAAASRDAVLNERLSRLQAQITDLDHKLSEANLSSQRLSAEMSALRQELAAGAPSPQAAATPVVATIQPAPAAPQNPLPPPSGTSPLVWIVILVILTFAVVFIVKHFMGMWADEADEDWIDEENGGYDEGEDERIQLSPEMGESAPPEESEERNADDEPKA